MTSWWLEYHAAHPAQNLSNKYLTEDQMECSAVFTLHACVHALTDRILHCQCSVQMGFSFIHSPTYAHTRASSHIVGTVVNGQLLTVFVLSFLVKSLYHFGASRYLTHMNDTNDA